MVKVVPGTVLEGYLDDGWVLESAKKSPSKDQTQYALTKFEVSECCPRTACYAATAPFVYLASRLTNCVDSLILKCISSTNSARSNREETERESLLLEKSWKHSDWNQDLFSYYKPCHPITKTITVSSSYVPARRSDGIGDREDGNIERTRDLLTHGRGKHYV